MDVYHLPLEHRVLGPILAQKARSEGERPYLTHGTRTYSFRETEVVVRGVARGLRGLGVQKGDPVALLLPNGPEFVFVWYACCLIGAVMVPINTAYTGQMLEYVLADSGSRGLVIARELASALSTVSSDVLERLEWIAVVGGTGRLDVPKGPKQYLDYEDLIEPEGADPEAPTDFSDTHCIMYTSGTTGPSKGVVIPNGHFFSSTCTFLRALALTRDDILFTPLPLFHGLASRLGVLPALLVGAQVVIADRFSASQFWREVTAAQATVAHTIFTIPPILKSKPPGPWDCAHRLRAMYNASYDAEFEARFGVRLVEAYGLTETGLVIYTPYPERVPGSCGKAHEHWEVQLVGEQDRPVSTGEIGEIVLRPRLPSIMMKGYLNKPEETLRAIRNLWFHTGDFARRDERGFFYFAGRAKDRIRRRGENISAWEIAKVVAGHPAVAECAALPHPAEAGEDDVRVVIALRAGSRLTSEELMNWLQGRLPYSMLPRYIEFVAELPRTPTNKVEKYRLVAQGLSETAWDREAAGYRIDRGPRVTSPHDDAPSP